MIKLYFLMLLFLTSCTLGVGAGQEEDRKCLNGYLITEPISKTKAVCEYFRGNHGFLCYTKDSTYERMTFSTAFSNRVTCYNLKELK